MIITDEPLERAILIGIQYPGQEEKEADDFLEELAFLTKTAGAVPVRKFVQKLDLPNPRTFLGSGKIGEIGSFVQENNIDIAIFDDELSPSQLRNIEKALGCRILDRTNLILDIFARRAPDLPRQDPGGARSVSVPASATHWNVDTSGETKGRHRPERSG